ncbi:hypothetical protein MHK12_09480 [Corynebacterium kefirresidentii]|uniref:hypothetical protein n=1 Tax=Corynebacterium TaxID=1716 RepID=UPI001EF31C71|nr:hypothetical protein [Corynebacterium kefirresidentii]MCG7451020.1 hypothetical protein [Corynebacterium kefirresidentii]MCG7452970.1 hypothetical protein [Corynebacterium kefirresidentii]
MTRAMPRPARSFLSVLTCVLVLAGVSGSERGNAQNAPAVPYFSTVFADKVTLTKNVTVSLGTFPTASGDVRVLELKGENLDIDNLGITLPGRYGDGMLTTGGDTTEVRGGPVTIMATGLKATPAVGDVSAPSAEIDLSRDDIKAVLDKLGVPEPHPVPDAQVPDVVMDHIELRDVTLELVNLTGAHFTAPTVTVGLG